MAMRACFKQNVLSLRFLSPHSPAEGALHGGLVACCCLLSTFEQAALLNCPIMALDARRHWQSHQRETPVVSVALLLALLVDCTDRL